ncbi:4163_t:CDS:1 [Acaulospora morrowiae]|uniref:4163_t:CDS:1 n=1 Tax=Acaulospora morrowiae TaxID=94023 RepID=A0A9N9EPM8_9GLOM|nr:4163_t:CDS:1 [Acaulospora morrowiae]
MVAGHTKFTSDSFFGLFKLKLRDSEVDNLKDLLKIVEESIVGGYNKAETIYNTNGSRKITFYNWIEFLDTFFTGIPSLLKQYYFIMTYNQKEIIKIQITINSALTKVNIAYANVITSTSENNYKCLK